MISTFSKHMYSKLFPEAKKTSVENAVKSEKNCELPFYIADLSDIVKNFRAWTLKLPNVKPFYAVKCNPDAVALRLMVSLGVGFDCASKWEIDQVLSAGANPQQIIYAHPHKWKGYIRHAADKGVDLMTFDSEGELIKIKETYPEARLLLRFRVPDVKAGFPLGDKFGCYFKECPKLLNAAYQLGLNVIGTSFHVGSSCLEPEGYLKAIRMSKQVFDIAADIGYRMTLVDLGGGYPNLKDSTALFDNICDCINEGLETYFHEYEGLQVIAEPGRYFVCSAFTLCTTVVGKREVEREFDGQTEEIRIEMMYYLNDGVFTSFQKLLYGEDIGPFRVQPHLKCETFRPMLASKLWGWSLDSSDCILPHCILPEMEVGEHILFENMGAYTSCLSSNFNGLPKPTVNYIFST